MSTRAAAALLAALVLAACPGPSAGEPAETAGLDGQDGRARAVVRGDGGSGISGTTAGWLRLPEPGRTRYAGDIRQASERYGVSPALVEAVIRVESAFNPFAVSHRGARGLMQLMPGTAQALGVQDAFNPRENIEGGVRHLRTLIDRYPGDLPRVLAAYNAGAGAVDFYRGIPPFPETRQYVDKVLQHPGVTARVLAAALPAGEPEATAAQPDAAGSRSDVQSGGGITRRLALGPGQPLPALPLIEESRRAARAGSSGVTAPVSSRAGDAEAGAGAARESITRVLVRMRERGLLGRSGHAAPDDASSGR